MRRRSIVGPLVLILVGTLFLLRNIIPDIPVFHLLATYWPFLLIVWGLLRIGEIVYSASQGANVRRTGLSGGEVVLAVFVCLAGSAMWSAQRFAPNIHIGPRALEVFGEQYEFAVAGQSQAAGVKRIVFENGRGNVRVTGSESPEVKISGRKFIRAYARSEAEEADRRTPLELKIEGDRLIVRTNQDKVDGNRRISTDLEVVAPKSVSIETHGTYGDYDIVDFAGPLDINSANAGVRINKVAGDVRIDLGRSDVIRAVDVGGTVNLQSGRGGDVELEKIAGQVTINGAFGGTLEFKALAKPLQFDSRRTELRVAAIPGQATLDLASFTARNVQGPVRLATSSRDVRIEDFTEAAEVEVERGDIELTPGKAPMPRIEARSRGGNIEIAIPDNAKFELDGVTERGEARNDYGPEVKTDSTGRSATLKASVGGGPSIRLNTQRGWISVRRSSIPSSRSTTEAKL